ncbi:hypothetical protein MSPP1_003927 [Malassezia sp. CBS 17886]|nr:hypothetical protein MSPP1_003927 [Malassezia sp. CBS 17886]
MSAAARGAAYELASLEKLSTWLGMQLYRTGGAGDRGIDLCGWWAPGALGGALDPLRTRNAAADPLRMRVVVQCKAEAKPMAPAVVRELEGTLVRAKWERLHPDVCAEFAPNLAAAEAARL